MNEENIDALQVHQLMQNAMMPCYKCLKHDANEWLPFFLKRVIEQAVFLPNANFYALIASYYMIPSAFATKFPLLLLQGESGTGKSTLGLIACLLHDIKPFSPTDTFASIRNQLNQIKYYPNGNERHCIMVWDDIDPRILSPQSPTFAMLKVGCDKKTDLLSISGIQYGSNMSFRVGCCKIISTIHPLLEMHGYQELVRRSILVETAKLSNNNHPELDLDDYDWQGLRLEFDQFWSITQNIENYILFKKLIKSHIKKINPLWIDLAAVSLVCKFFEEEDDENHPAMIAKCVAYFQQISDSLKNPMSSLEYHVTQFIQDVENTLRKQLKDKTDYVPAIIKTREIKALWEKLIREGVLDKPPRIDELRAIMMKLGYRLIDLSWEKI